MINIIHSIIYFILIYIQIVYFLNGFVGISLDLMNLKSNKYVEFLILHLIFIKILNKLKSIRKISIKILNDFLFLIQLNLKFFSLNVKLDLKILLLSF